jgi:hypothetical protein
VNNATANVIIARELVKIAREIVALGPGHIGLPGNRGGKAHYWFMVGNATASKGKPSNPPDFLSKECAKAYHRGYNLGVKQKEKQP